MEISAHKGYRRLSILALAGLILIPGPALACSCATGGHTPCGEITLGSAAFTGRVVSVSPAFLNRLNQSSRLDAGRVAQFYDQLAGGAPSTGIQELKQTFLSLVPALSPEVAARLKEADSRQKLLDLFDMVLDHGSNVTFEVKTVFAKGGDDDDDRGNHPDNYESSELLRWRRRLPLLIVVLCALCPQPPSE